MHHVQAFVFSKRTDKLNTTHRVVVRTHKRIIRAKEFNKGPVFRLKCPARTILCGQFLLTSEPIAEDKTCAVWVTYEGREARKEKCHVQETRLTDLVKLIALSFSKPDE